MAWKVDLSKAYDRVSWKYIMDVLWEVGLRVNIYNLIHQCITTVNTQFYLMGKKLVVSDLIVVFGRLILSHLIFLL